MVLQNAVNLLLETLREQHLGNKPVAGAGSQVSIDAIAEGTVSLDDLQANGGAAAAATTAKTATAAPTAMDAIPTGSGSGGGSKSSSRDAARSFKQVVSFHAPIDELFDSFVDPGRIMAYTQVRRGDMGVDESMQKRSGKKKGGGVRALLCHMGERGRCSAGHAFQFFLVCRLLHSCARAVGCRGHGRGGRHLCAVWRRGDRLLLGDRGAEELCPAVAVCVVGR